MLNYSRNDYFQIIKRKFLNQIHHLPKRQLSQSLKSQFSRHRHIKPADAISDPQPEHRGYTVSPEALESL